MTFPSAYGVSYFWNGQKWVEAYYPVMQAPPSNGDIVIIGADDTAGGGGPAAGIRFQTGTGGAAGGGSRGGSFDILCGDSNGNVNGADITITAGLAGTIGFTGGGVGIAAGYGASQGGTVNIDGGGGDSGGGVYLIGGDSGASSYGGNIHLEAGVGTTGPGMVTLNGCSPTTVVRTVAYTASLADHTIRANATGGAFSVTLPPAVDAFDTAKNCGQVIVVKRLNAGVNNVTVKANAAELIDGVNTKLLVTQYAAIMLQSNGVGWDVLSAS